MAKPDRILADALSRLDHDAVLARILDNGLFAVMLVSLDGQIVFANDACCRMIGRDRGELIARQVDDLVHRDDLAASHHDRHSIMQDEAGSREFERRYMRGDERLAWAKGSVSLLCDKKTGAPLMLAYLLADVTPLKEMALEKERLHVTLHSIGDAVICTDTQSLVTFMNPIAERLTGWTATEAAGHSIGEIFNLIEERSGRPPVSLVERCMNERQALAVESGTILLSRTGDAYDISLSAAPVRTAGGILGSIVTFNDLTKIVADQRKVARSALRDGLTGLPNRGAFIEKLAVALKRGTRGVRTLCASSTSIASSW